MRAGGGEHSEGFPGQTVHVVEVQTNLIGLIRVEGFSD